MAISVQYTGYVKDIVDKSSEQFEHLKTTEDLKTELNNKYPELNRTYYTLSHNGTLVSKSQELVSGDVIILICPFAGG